VFEVDHNDGLIRNVTSLVGTPFWPDCLIVPEYIHPTAQVYHPEVYGFGPTEIGEASELVDDLVTKGRRVGVFVFPDKLQVIWLEEGDQQVVELTAYQG
jgi:hypothetical protein